MIIFKHITHILRRTLIFNNANGDENGASNHNGGSGEESHGRSNVKVD